MVELAARRLAPLAGAALVVLGMVAVACGGDAPRGTTPAGSSASSAPRGSVHSLARAAGGALGRVYMEQSTASTGTVAGTVTGPDAAPDTTIVPTHDLRACARFTEPVYPAADGGVGEAVVWLAGVASGRENDMPRRVTMALRDCRLTPRVERIATGGTIIISSHDAIMSRLRFLDIEAADSVRATVAMNDDGQVVPLSDPTRAPGLVAIRDDLHPWVRGYLAVAPHPFVAVTEANGRFTFERVPAGTYTLVVWHERFGTKTQPITVGAGKEESMEIRLR